MAKYKCTESPSAKVWKDGVNIGGQVDEVKFGATVTAEKQGTALYITAGANRGKQGWSKLQWFDLVQSDPVTPPPPSSGKRSFTLFVDGFKPFNGELEQV